MKSIRSWTCGLALLLGVAADAAVPTLDHVYPVALQRGTTNTVAVIGKFDPWPAEFWVEGQGISITATTNKATVQMVVAPEAAVGPRLVRAFNAEGATAPRFLVVTAEPQVAEIEPNDERAKAQSITNLPAWINGRLDKNGDVDQYAVELATGQTLVASLQAYVLQSPVDAALRLFDPRGVEVLFNHDDGRTLDPQLVFTATSPGRHTLQVFGFVHPAGSEIRFTGNDKCVYRLNLATGPWVSHTLPLGVQAGVTNQVQVKGWNLAAHVSGVIALDVPLTATNAPWWTTTLPNFVQELRLPVGVGPELLEREPNGAVTNAQELPVPSAVTGMVSPVGDVDRFVFEAKKDDRLSFAIQSAVLGFPLDAWLAVENSEGKELTRNDDASGGDPRIDWTAPQDGRFVLSVGSVLHRGDDGHRYRLSVERTQPDFRATVDASAISLAAGATNDVKLTIARLHGYAGRLTVTTSGLPTGVSAAPLEIVEKAGEGLLKLVAETNAPAFNGSWRISLVGDGRQHTAVLALATTGENNGVPQGYTELLVRETDALWLTVVPPKPEATKPEEKK